MKAGDRVRYIHVNSEEEAVTGFFPPVGTLGTVKVVDEFDVLVKWDSGVIPNGIWYCEHKYVEVVRDDYCDAEELTASDLDISCLYG